MMRHYAAVRIYNLSGIVKAFTATGGMCSRLLCVEIHACVVKWRGNRLYEISAATLAGREKFTLAGNERSARFDATRHGAARRAV